MKSCVINSKFIVNLVPGLLLMVVATAHAGNVIHQPYSLQLAGGQLNPWALPPAPEKRTNIQPSPQQRNQSYYRRQGEIEYPGFRFVTPEILESLKQQQIQNQQVPGNYPQRGYRQPQSMPPQYMPPQYTPQQSMPGYSGYPGTGMGLLNPLYDTPAISPWNNGGDMLSPGESFPWLPNAAIGDIAPLSTQPWTENDGAQVPQQEFKQNKSEVFNPFTFGPNGNL